MGDPPGPTGTACVLVERLKPALGQPSFLGPRPATVVKSTVQFSDLICSPVLSLDVFLLFVQNSTLPLRQFALHKSRKTKSEQTGKWKSVEKLFHAL